MFKIEYENEVTYEEKVVLEIRLKVKPDSEDYQELMGAIDSIDKFANKYLTFKASPVIAKGRFDG